MLFSSAPADAATNTVVISHVQAGAATGQVASVMQEFVVIYNNDNQSIDITNWCISNLSKPLINFACVAASSTNHMLYLAPYSYAVIVSDHFSVQHDNYRADVIFPTTNNSSGSIAAGTETLTLKNQHDIAVDTVSWSTTAFSPTGGFILQRRVATDLKTMIDTGTVATDFSKVMGVELPPSGVYEVVVDACENLAEIQATIPVGLFKDIDGNCLEDVCVNLDGLQITVPEEYLRRGVNECAYDYVQLQITELLANAAGSDVGREFIELRNPTNRIAFLVNYTLKIGDKIYAFPAGLKINPGQYMAFYNNEIIFTLLNTTSSATLLGDDGSVISRSDIYENPKDDMAWAMIGNVWQYTNQLTFASANIPSVDEPEGEEVADGLSPCAANQYRHPETRRCRLLVTVASAVTPCKDGQYRSEETNRCRKIALAGDTLKPCQEHQYRSEETNRCRNLVSTIGTLKPCKDDQYRSEETNRCRKITTTNVPAAAFAVEPIAETEKAFVGWYVLSGIGMVAIGYAAWEWRREAMSAIRRIALFFTKQ